MKRFAETTGGIVILSLPEKLKVVKLWENLPVPVLIEHALARGEGILGPSGQLIVDTRPHTGRSPKDKFFVASPRAKRTSTGARRTSQSTRQISTASGIASRPISPSARSIALDCYAGADERYRLPLRVYTELAWHSSSHTTSSSARDTAIPTSRPSSRSSTRRFFGDPQRDGTRSGRSSSSTSRVAWCSSAERATPARSRSRSSR